MDVFGDSLIDSWGQGQVEEAVGLCAPVKGIYVAVEALVGGSVIGAGQPRRSCGQRALQLGLLLRGSLGNMDTNILAPCPCSPMSP